LGVRLGLEEQVKGWYSLARRALSFKVEGLKEVKPSSIVFLGLGGSGIVGDYVKTLCYDRLSIPVHVVKEARLPRWVGKDSLVVAVSYSGNTLETLMAVEEALRRGCQVYVVSSNGRLIELAHRRELPYVKLDEGYAPRAALPLMFYPCLNLLGELGLNVVEDDEIEESLEVLRDLDESLREAEGIALSLIEDRTPAIIADARYEALAWRFKSDLNENAKMSAKCEVVPESMHNDVVGYERRRSPLRALIISAGDDHLYTKLLEGFVKENLEEAQVSVKVLRLRGKSMLAKLMHGSHVSGLTSVAAAKMLGVEPEPTPSISKYKKALEELAK